MIKIFPIIFLAGCFNYTGPQKVRFPTGSLFSEKCVERKDLQPTIEATHAAVVDACIKAGFCTKKPIGRYWVCLTHCKTYCAGWFKNGVHGCAGSNAIYIALGPWSFKALLVHEMLKNLVVSRFTILPWDTPDHEISTDKRFTATEQAALKQIEKLPDERMECK